MNEFGIISQYFAKLGAVRDDVLLGIGDDAAVLEERPGEMVVCTDTLVADVHFPADDPAETIGFRSLAVNLSDLAAMGASPVWATLNLTVPHVDEGWIGAFCRGFDELARRYDVALVGGDTTRGPLTVTVTAGGRMDARHVMRRSNARVGQPIFLSGPVGDGALGLRVARGLYRPDAADAAYLLGRFRRPEPAIAAGRALTGIGRAAIDISDGLLADLGHVLEASGSPGADLEIVSEAFSAPARRFLDTGGDPGVLLGGGDDYVLLFTIDPDDVERLERAAEDVFSPIAIGSVSKVPGVRVRDHLGRPVVPASPGYEHFDDDQSVTDD